MRVRCIFNTGEELRAVESKLLGKDTSSEFGATATYGLIIGQDYVVMGIILGEGSLNYLVDSAGYISAYPYMLFEVIDHTLPCTWFFKAFNNNDPIYPYKEAIWGYHELVFDNNHYEKLVECDEDAKRVYFRRKIEFEDGIG